VNPNFKALTPVTTGDKIFDVVTAARINAMQELLKQLWSGENLRSGGNVQIVPSANGPTVNVLAGGSGGSSQSGEKVTLLLCSGVTIEVYGKIVT
jgi:hypothetical protein